MPWSYCVRWNKLLHEPIDPLSEDEARACHQRGELYTAFPVGEDGEGTFFVIEVRLETGYACRRDFDEYHRLSWSRLLNQYEDRMFLVESYMYGYGDSTEFLRQDEFEYLFYRRMNPDGNGFETRRRKGDPMVEEMELSLKEGQNLDHYWTRVPEFGDYSDIALVGIDPEDLEKYMN